MLTHAAQARTRSMPAPAAACVALGFLIAIWALARVPVVAAAGAERWRMALDRTIASVGCGAVLWYVGLAPMLSAREPWSRQAMLLVGLGFLVAVGAATKVSYIAGGPVDRVAMRLIAAGGGVPAGAMTSVDVPLIAVAFGAPLRWPVRVVLIAAVVVTVLVMVRQYLAYREIPGCSGTRASKRNGCSTRSATTA